MANRNIVRVSRRSRLKMVCLIWISICGGAHAANAQEISGQWFGTWESETYPGLTSRLQIHIFEFVPGFHAGYATVPDLGLFQQLLPVTIDGSTVTIGDPTLLAFVGTISGTEISGATAVPSPLPPYFDVFNWHIWRDTGIVPSPPNAPVPECSDLPDLYCTGSAEHCSEIIAFEPESGDGYINYPANFETWDDQYRSFLRRDLRNVVSYASAKTACQAGEWDYWNFSPIGLGDMSEADGAIPGTSIGFPAHPDGTHEGGLDIDTAYYQLFAADNQQRVIGNHYDTSNADQFRLTETPVALDVWRSALYIANLSEHPRIRVIGVDGEAGVLLDAALDDLVTIGWIDPDRRSAIPLAYELTNTGLGWYFNHHHHMHISLYPVEDIVASARIAPHVLKKRRGRALPIVVSVEMIPDFDANQIDPDSLALIVDGQTLIQADSKFVWVTDYNKNGIQDITALFPGEELLEKVSTGVVEITISGLANDTFFQTTESVRVW